MSIVSVSEVKVLHNVAPFGDPFFFQIKLNSVQDLQDGALLGSIILFAGFGPGCSVLAPLTSLPFPPTSYVSLRFL